MSPIPTKKCRPAHTHTDDTYSSLLSSSLFKKHRHQILLSTLCVLQVTNTCTVHTHTHPHPHQPTHPHTHTHVHCTYFHPFLFALLYCSTKSFKLSVTNRVQPTQGYCCTILHTHTHTHSDRGVRIYIPLQSAW